MTSRVRRSIRSRSSLNLKFTDDPDFDQEAFEYDQGDEDDDEDDDIDELPVARIKQEQQRHASQNNTNSGIVKRRRGRPSKRETLHDNDDEWHAEHEEDFSTGTPVDVTLSPTGPDVDASVYEFSETSNRKKLPTVDSFGSILSRDSTKTPIKVRRDEKHLCPYCNYCTGKKYLLQRHLKSHSTERPHKCAYCSNTFKTTAQLQNHVNTHLGIKPFQCKFCEYKFTTSGELIRHVRYKHTLEKPHKCEECGYATVELSKLRRHIRTHTGEKPYSCPHCSYCSPDTFKLKRHLRVHTGERPYQCTVCKFRFTQSNSLKAHMLTHETNAQKFHCTYCPTVLTRKADLKQHMSKKHANDEDFVTCLKCDQEFTDPHELTQHKKLHHAMNNTNNNFNTPRVQLSCSLCTYKTFSQDILDDHMDSQHRDERTFQCNECGLMYATRGDLRQHITKVHRCGVYAKMPAGGLSMRQRSHSSSLKNSQRSSNLSTSPIKHQAQRCETIYRCSICRSKFSHLRAIERHHYDIHHIDPFDTEAMKNSTVIDEEETQDDYEQQQEQQFIEINQVQQSINDREEDEQMAIIQFRNQNQNHDHSPLIVKIERDGYDDFETADDYISNKRMPRTYQLQKSRRRLSKMSYDDSSCLDSPANKKEFLNNSNYDDADTNNENETADIFVEVIDDDQDNNIDDNNFNIIKYRSSTHKLT
ncbi:unnamed protein product [Rotaria socialis]|uniref:C2H2-type domain-containing protein n=1 Tax=Rotaria socialis TaxID=392032 RepID=A0A820CT53_9BILA|nr:unnamed protein product [Rotaria socialis]CAF3422106.1 unnamed protein product [Rotaria socialis]CAF4222654.1 unnamed protein product [Rotaria socialis]CAF4491559.1 unnamed protein product [Rotaria socialis]